MSNIKYKNMEKIVIVGSGVVGINAALTLVDGGYPGNLITIIDKGEDPYNRKPEEVMTGFAGAGGMSDGKITMSTEIGGQLSKYCGEEKAMKLMQQVVDNFTRFHPKPNEIYYSNPQEEPEFIKPYFGLRLFPVYHVGSDYLNLISKNWYDYLVNRGVKFEWETEVRDVDFKNNIIRPYKNGSRYFAPPRMIYDKLIFAVGKSGIDLAKKIADIYQLPTENKSCQIGVRFEAPQKYFQKLIDISYDFKLYRKYDNVSIRSFCTNNNAAYVAVENTYGNISYNGHAKRGEEFQNNMTNFGILMEIKGIENPFEWSRNIVSKFNTVEGKGTYYSPKRHRGVSKTSEKIDVEAYQIDSLDIFQEIFGEYAKYVLDFIEDLQKVFPEMGDDWGIYIPEVKYLNPEVKVNYEDLSLINYPDVHFAGDALSARGISVAGAHGILIASSILKDNLSS